MKIIKLNKAQFDYLDYVLSEQQDLSSKLKIKIENQFVYITIDDDTADQIRDCVGEELQRVGFDENYELTPEGIILENLIDLFY